MADRTGTFHFDPPLLYRFLNDLYDRTGTPVTVLDTEGRTVLSVGARDNCKSCDQVAWGELSACETGNFELAGRIVRQGNGYRYCDKGLFWGGVLLRIDGEPIGLLRVGPISVSSRWEEAWQRYAAAEPLDARSIPADRDDGPNRPERMLSACRRAAERLERLIARPDRQSSNRGGEAVSPSIGQENEDLLRNIFGQSPIGIELYDGDGILQDANRACLEIFGVARVEQVRGFKLFEDPNIDEVEKEKIRRGETVRFSRIFDFEKVKQNNLYPTSKSGRIYLDVLISPLGTEAGWPTGYLVQIQNVTRKYRMEQELRHAEKMRVVGRLAGGIAHDFNNQLMGMMGYASLLKEELRDPVLQSYADQIIKAGNRSADLTQKLLVFSGQGHVYPRRIDLHELLDEMLQPFSIQTDSPITVVHNYRAVRTSIQGDPQQLHNAVLNLIENARDAMLQEGRIFVETENVTMKYPRDFGESQHLSAGEYFVLRVRDTGTGIPEEVRPHIFEPFYTTKPIGKGTGMGLPAVLGIVSLHGGVVDVRSHPGKETVFTIYLPLAGGPAEAAVSVGGKDKASYCILVADEEELARHLLVEMLQNTGYQVAVVASGGEAIDYFSQHSDRIDLVVLDVASSTSGREVFAKLEAIRSDVKVLVLSGRRTDENILEMLRGKQVDFLRKPLANDEFRRKIDEMLNA